MLQKFKFKKGLLFIMPFLLLITWIYNVKETNYATFRTVDPEYIHLTSSINLAGGQYKLISIESPATSLYIFGAAVVRITHLISGGGRSLMDDYLLFPEKYIFSFRISLIFLMLISLICLGLIVYKYSQNMFQALFLQVIPFVSIIILDCATMVCPENFLVTIMIWYVLFLVLLTHKYIKESRVVLYFSFLVGIGLATKLTFVPFLLPPIFLFSKNKYRIFYLILISFTTLILAFPAVIQYERFYSWVKGLIFHTGLYGNGEEKIIDRHLFKTHFLTIVTSEILFIVSYIFLILNLPAYFIFKKKNKKTFLLFLSIFIVFTIQIILTSKHFALRYLIPSLMLTLYVVYEVFSFYKPRFLSFITQKANWLPYGLILAVFLLGSFSLIKENNILREHRESRLGAFNYIENNLKDKVKIINPNFYSSSAAKEYSLHHAALWTGIYKDIYYGRLNELYPTTYFYFPWDERYYKWNVPSRMIDIIKKYDEIYYYGALDATNAELEDYNNEIKSRFDYYNQLGGKIIEYKTVYKSKYDVIYKLKVDSNLVNKMYDYEEMACDMERILADNKFFDTNSPYQLSYNNNRCSTTSFSGKYSQILNKKAPWGSGVKISKVAPGSNYEVTVWKKSNDDRCVIVAAADKAEDLYISSNTIVQQKNGWDQLKLIFESNKKIDNKSIQIYVWYNGENQVFIDDFKIKVGKVRQVIPN
ncbi:MAG: hypothetical protein WCH34_00835 [Bacteroidota bacterium]